MERSLILKRDNFTCQNCGNETVSNLLIHYINYNNLDKSEYNEVTLCKSCNAMCRVSNPKSFDYFINFSILILDIYKSRHWSCLLPNSPIRPRLPKHILVNKSFGYIKETPTRKLDRF